jgi:hypothetical protein
LAYRRLVIAVELFQQREIEGPDSARLGGAGDLTPHRHIANCTGLQPQNRGRVSDFYPVSRWGVLAAPAGHWDVTAVRLVDGRRSSKSRSAPRLVMLDFVSRSHPRQKFLKALGP